MRETLEFWNAPISKYIQLFFAMFDMEKLLILSICKFRVGLCWTLVKEAAEHNLVMISGTYLRWTLSYFTQIWAAYDSPCSERPCYDRGRLIVLNWVASNSTQAISNFKNGNQFHGTEFIGALILNKWKTVGKIKSTHVESKRSGFDLSAPLRSRIWSSFASFISDPPDLLSWLFIFM